MGIGIGWGSKERGGLLRYWIYCCCFALFLAFTAVPLSFSLSLSPSLSLSLSLQAKRKEEFKKRVVQEARRKLLEEHASKLVRVKQGAAGDGKGGYTSACACALALGRQAPAFPSLLSPSDCPWQCN